MATPARTLLSVLVLNVLVWKSFSFSFIRNLSRRLLLSPLFNRYYRLSFISILLKYSAYRLSSPSRFHQIRTFILSFLSSFSFFLLLYFSSFLSSRLSHILPLFIYCLFFIYFFFCSLRLSIFFFPYPILATYFNNIFLFASLSFRFFLSFTFCFLLTFHLTLSLLCAYFLLFYLFFLLFVESSSSFFPSY